jgi:hypothetical protein
LNAPVRIARTPCPDFFLILISGKDMSQRIIVAFEQPQNIQVVLQWVTTPGPPQLDEEEH